MNIKVDNLSFEEAKLKLQNLSAVIYYMSDTIVEKNFSGDVDWDECLEARFFNETEEYHFYLEDTKWNVIHVVDSDEPSNYECIKRKYPLRRAKYGKGSFTVCEYLCPDSDGQMCIAVTRLFEVEKEADR